MVSVELMGRLGNNLFQIAALTGVSEKYNVKAYYPKWDNSKYFNVPEHEEFTEFFKYSEPKFAFQEIPYRKGLVLNGYFQSERYFKHCEDKVREQFKINTELLNPDRITIPETPHNCSIHVRRGDYLRLQEFHPVMKREYYELAMKKVTETVGNKVNFYVFSDDYRWCYDVFINHMNVKIMSDDGNVIEDLVRMSACDSHILSNSSYSWWGSWLDNKKSGITVAPSKWFGPALAYHDTSDLYCPDWKVI